MFTARYELGLEIKQSALHFKGLKKTAVYTGLYGNTAVSLYQTTARSHNHHKCISKSPVSKSAIY